MNAAVIPFMFKNAQIRALAGNDGIPVFVAADVATVLGYRDSRDMVRMCVDDEKGTHEVRTLGGNQMMSTITEPGLYRVIFRSQRPETEPFLRWVTHEVLPSIRKTGSYQREPEQLTKHMAAAEFTIKTLRLDRASSHRLIVDAAKADGIEMPGLPNYTPAQGEQASMTALLSEHDSKRGVKSVNKALASMGYLVRIERGEGQRGYWSVTIEGTRYGLNMIAPQATTSSSPRWYRDTFPQLLAELRASSY